MERMTPYYLGKNVKLVIVNLMRNHIILDGKYSMAQIMDYKKSRFLSLKILFKNVP